MKLRTTATVATLVIAALAATVAPTASAGVTCQTDATAAIAGAAVNGPRQGWTPPVWTFDMPSLSMSVDVQADTLSEAQGKAQAWLAGEVQRACDAEQQSTQRVDSGGATTAAAPTQAATTQATQLVTAADVQYVGNSWGPLPLWRVAIPSLNLTVDVAAADEAGARAAAIGSVAGMLGGGTPTVDAPATTTQAQTQSTTSGTASAPTVVAAGGDQATRDALLVASLLSGYGL